MIKKVTNFIIAFIITTIILSEFIPKLDLTVLLLK